MRGALRNSARSSSSSAAPTPSGAAPMTPRTLQALRLKAGREAGDVGLPPQPPPYSATPIPPQVGEPGSIPYPRRPQGEYLPGVADYMLDSFDPWVKAYLPGARQINPVLEERLAEIIRRGDESARRLQALGVPVAGITLQEPRSNFPASPIGVQPPYTALLEPTEQLDMAQHLLEHEETRAHRRLYSAGQPRGGKRYDETLSRDPVEEETEYFVRDLPRRPRSTY